MGMEMAIFWLDPEAIRGAGCFYSVLECCIRPHPPYSSSSCPDCQPPSLCNLLLSELLLSTSETPHNNKMGHVPDAAKEGFSQSGFVDTRSPVAPKRLIVCCDGTWQSSVSGLTNIPSNITRLSRAIARSGKDKDGKVWQQVVHYDAGIGTGDLSQAEKDRQGGFGIGFVGNVIEAYNFIVLNYSLGDEIFCFGFSRGAYTARAVAGLITDIGVISPRDLQDFPELYAKYQGYKDSFHFRKSAAYRAWVNGVLSKEQPPKVEGGFQEPPRYDVPAHRPAPEESRVVKVVGVFDTVGSLGIPDLTWTQYNLKFLEKYTGVTDPGFHNVSLSPCKSLAARSILLHLLQLADPSFFSCIRYQACLPRLSSGRASRTVLPNTLAFAYRRGKAYR